MSRLLWLTNAPWTGSGYAEQAALFMPRLQQQGHDVALLCNYGLHGQETRWNGITCYPSDGLWGNVSLGTYADHFRADQIIALCDAWVLRPDAWPEGMAAALWTPVDHWPIPPAVLGVLQQPNIQPVAMSRFGFEQMEQFELEPLYIPHGVDTGMFRPQREIRDAVRAELDIPADVFLVGMVAANKSSPGQERKNFDGAFQAFAEFARRHDDAWMYVHSQANPPGPGSGVPLDRVAEVARCPAGRVRFPHASAWQLGIPRQAVAYTMAALDVLLMPSLGEGFGIPLVEAQASGVPVIASDHSAMTELVGAGWLVEGQAEMDHLQGHAYFFRPFNSSILACLEAAYDARDDLELRGRAVEFAADYDADVVAEQYWRPALAELLDPQALEAAVG